MDKKDEQSAATKDIAEDAKNQLGTDLPEVLPEVVPGNPALDAQLDHVAEDSVALQLLPSVATDGEDGGEPPVKEARDSAPVMLKAVAGSAVKNQPAGTPPLKKKTRTRARVGDCIKGRFELLDVLGVGGMGVVYRARDLRQKELGDSNPYVAFKVLNERLSVHSAALIALQQEYKRSQQLAHPNIVNVFDFDREGRLVYMTMELLDGTPLDRIVNHPDFRGLPFDHILPWVLSIAEALDYAHQNRIIHSDLKPSNIFVVDKNQAKVLDFGIGRVMETVQSKAMDQLRGLSAMTPAYASAGMLQEEAPMPADDLYAMAIVVYQLLTGRHPYSRADAMTVKRDNLRARPISRMPPSSWRILKQALDPELSKTLTMREFIEGFRPRPKKNYRIAMIAGAVAGIMALSSSLYYYSEHLQHQAMLTHLQSGEPDQVAHGLKQLADLPNTERLLALNQTRSHLMAYAKSHTASLIEARQWAEASTMLATLGMYFPDSRQLGELEQQLQQARIGTQSQLAADLKNLESRLLTFNRVDMTQWFSQLGVLKNLNSEHELLEEPLLTDKITLLIHSLILQNQVDLARYALEQAESLFSDSETLLKAATVVDQYNAQGADIDTFTVSGVMPHIVHAPGVSVSVLEQLSTLKYATDPDLSQLIGLIERIEHEQPRLGQDLKWAVNQYLGGIRYRESGKKLYQEWLSWLGR